MRKKEYDLPVGFSYTDIFAKSHIWQFGLKSIDLKYGYVASKVSKT
jgi:hypothetical protein